MIKKWNEFILERLGVSDVTLVYTEIILSYLENIIDDILSPDLWIVDSMLV